MDINNTVTPAADAAATVTPGGAPQAAAGSAAPEIVDGRIKELVAQRDAQKVRERALLAELETLRGGASATAQPAASAEKPAKGADDAVTALAQRLERFEGDIKRRDAEARALAWGAVGNDPSDAQRFPEFFVDENGNPLSTEKGIERARAKRPDLFRAVRSSPGARGPSGPATTGNSHYDTWTQLNAAGRALEAALYLQQHKAEIDAAIRGNGTR